MQVVEHLNDEQEGQRGQEEQVKEDDKGQSGVVSELLFEFTEVLEQEVSLFACCHDVYVLDDYVGVAEAGNQQGNQVHPN